MDGIAQHRVAEEPGRQGLEVAVVLVPDRVRSFLEDEEFVLETDARGVAQPGAPFDDPAEHAAGAIGVRGRGEFAKEQQHVVLPRDRSARFGHDSHGRIGISRVPPGERDIVVKLIVGVPSQDHVAESESAFERREELLAAHVLSAQHAVDVEDADFDVGQAPFFDDRPRIGRRLHIARVHRLLHRADRV